jgi:hypothetical protein
MSDIQPKPIVSVSVTVSVESNKGTGWWVTLTNSIGQALTPEMHYIRDRSISSAHEWADFLGIPITPFLDPETGLEVLPEMDLSIYKDHDCGKPLIKK